MKNLSKFLILLFFLISSTPLLSQNIGSITIDLTNILTQVNEIQSINEYDEGLDGAPGILILVVSMFIFIFVTVGIGIVLAIFILLLIFGFITLGITSASILVGLNKKSFSKGFKTFVVSSSTIGGLILGVFGFWLLNKITHWWNLSTSLTIGSISGIVSGFSFGFFLFFIIQKFTTFLNSKLKMNKIENDFS